MAYLDEELAVGVCVHEELRRSMVALRKVNILQGGGERVCQSSKHHLADQGITGHCLGKLSSGV